MAPSEKDKAIPAKRGRQNDNSGRNYTPPAKKGSFLMTRSTQSSRVSPISQTTSHQSRPSRPAQYCDLEDDESVRKYTKAETQIFLKPMSKPAGDFPRFKDGDVVIELVSQHSKYTYQLHHDVLQRASPWFEDLLNWDMMGAEPDPQFLTSHPILRKLWARFQLRYSSRLEIHELERSSFTYAKEPEQVPIFEQREEQTQMRGDLNAGIESSTLPSTPHTTDANADLGMGQVLEPPQDCPDQAMDSGCSDALSSSTLIANHLEDFFVVVFEQEKVDEDVVMVDLSMDTTVVNEGHANEIHLADLSPIPATDNLAIKTEEIPTLLPPSQSISQDEPPPSAYVGTGVDIVGIKEEDSNAFTIANNVEMKASTKDEDQVGLNPELSAAEDIHNRTNFPVLAASPGSVDIPEITLEPTSSLVCTSEMNFERLDIDTAEFERCQKKDCLMKSPGLGVLSLASKNDDVGNSNFSKIPQGDSPSEENASLGRNSPKSSSTGARQQSSMKGSHFSTAAFAFSKRSSENQKQPVETEKGEFMVDKVRSSADTGAGQSQGTDDFISDEKQAVHTDKGQAISVASTNSSKVLPVTSTAKPSNNLLHAYNNLFLIYYSRTPIISTLNVEIAYEQSHLLITVASLYGSIPLVRPYINSALMNFGRELYMAIMADPPRWNQLSFYLESELIFQESMIHIVGNLPYWPWSSLQFEKLFTPTQKLIGNKMNVLRALKASVNKSLHSNTVGEVEVFSRSVDKNSFDTWFVAQYWRDRFARSLAQANAASDKGQKCARGKVYRDLHRGGEAYLPTVLVLDAVEACVKKDLSTKSKRQGVEQDLKTLKDFARKEVQELCANYSMLPVEDAGIKYLTCIKIEKHEFPWAK